MLQLTRSSMIISLKISQNNCLCGSIGYWKNKKNRILTSIGVLIIIILLFITQSITNRNITKRQEKIFTIQIKLHSITICKLHAVTHTERVCWEENVCPEYNGIITTKCRCYDEYTNTLHPTSLQDSDDTVNGQILYTPHHNKMPIKWWRQIMSGLKL